MTPLSLVMLCALAAEPPRLPLKSLVLYENGLGYFERKGQVAEGQVAWIPLEPGQLDDALKTLVVMSERGVASVEFEPPLSPEAARAQAGLPEEEGGATLPSLLMALKGVDVRVARKDGGALRGRVVDVVKEEERDKEGHPFEVELLLVFGEGGLLRVPLKQVTGVRPVDPAVQLSWERATGASATHIGQSWLKVRGSSGSGQVAVGYTTEAAVWRTTYRLVMDKGGARLQGYALVHNDSDEAWDGVKVTLASGKPSSFLMPLAGPRYGRRELVTPSDGLETAPQLATQEAREHLLGNSGGAVYGGLSLSGHGSGGGGVGYGAASGSLGGKVDVSSTVSTLLEGGPTPLAPAAVSEAGDLFLYTVADLVKLGARKSALLPILDARADGERVTVIDPGGAAFTGVRLTNSTQLTLEGGTVSVFTDAAYAGEAQLDRLKPGEVRVVQHGEDLDVQVHRKSEAHSGPVKLFKRVGTKEAPALELHRIDKLVHTLELVSRAKVTRTLLVQLPRESFRVMSGAQEDVRSPGEPRYARLTLGAKEKKTVQVVEEGALKERIGFDQLSTSKLDAMLAEKVAEPVRGQLLAVRAEVARVESAKKRLDELAARQKAVEADVTRVRDNLAAAGKGGAQEAAKKLGEKLLSLEEELVRIAEEQLKRRSEIDAARLAVASR
jgi:hypothetical protein